MDNHIERMAVEQKELEEKMMKLFDFIKDNPIYKTLPIREQMLMAQQLGFMKSYFDVLTQRINDTTGGE